MAAGLVERWVGARRALTEAEDSHDWDGAEREAETSGGPRSSGKH